MPLKLTKFEGRGSVATLNRWADEIEQKIHATNRQIAFVNTSGGAGSGGTSGGGGGATFSAITIVTANYLAVSTDEIILVNSASPVTITLPVNSLLRGKVWRIKTINTGVVTIVGASGTIDGNSDATLALIEQSIDVACDGTNFEIL